MKKIFTKIKENKQIAIPVILIIILLIGIGIYLLVDHFSHPEINDYGWHYDEEHDVYIGEESRFKDSIKVETILRDTSEYLGEYENYDEETDYNFLSVIYEDFVKGDFNTELILDFIDYKFPKGEYVIDSKGNKKSIGMNDKKFMLYFTNVFEDSNGNLVTDTYGEGIKSNKEAIENYFDMEVYILPRTPDVEQEDFLKVFDNGNFYNGSISKTFAEILGKIDDKYAVALYFNEDGSLLFATSMVSFEVGIDIVDYAIKSNISLQEAFPVILQNYQNDQKARNNE